MVPPEIADEIKAQFPHVKVYYHESPFLSGFAVEIMVHGHPQRNGWQVKNASDWPEVKDKAMKWLMCHCPS